MKKKNPRIAIIMPAYNEGDTIEATVNEIYKKVIKRLPNARLMVFEDGSTDDTKEVLARLARRYAWLETHFGGARMGFSNAVKKAFASVDERKYDYVLSMDSDGQYDPQDLFKLLAAVDKMDMVVGCRADRIDAFHRVLLSKGVDFIARSMFNIKYPDVTSAFRLTNTKIAKQLAKEVSYSKNSFWTEFAARAAKKNLAVTGVSISHRRREGGGGTKVYKIQRIPGVIVNELTALIKTKMD
jgi:glycosyltransferase involved in cell wall biosynthesis